MAVSWVTIGTASTSETVNYGVNKGSLSQAVTGHSSVYSEGMATPIRIHDAVMTNLEPNTVYYYQVQGDSTVRSFTAQPQRPGGKVYAVLADLGYSNAVSLSQLIAEAANGEFDAVIHADKLLLRLCVRCAWSTILQSETIRLAATSHVLCLHVMRPITSDRPMEPLETIS
jgi:hypothetical protein